MLRLQFAIGWYIILGPLDLEKPKMILIGPTVKYKIKQFVNLPVSTAIHWYMTDEFLFFSDKTCGHLLKTGAGDPSRNEGYPYSFHFAKTAPWERLFSYAWVNPDTSQSKNQRRLHFTRNKERTKL